MTVDITKTISILTILLILLQFIVLLYLLYTSHIRFKEEKKSWKRFDELHRVALNNISKETDDKK